MTSFLRVGGIQPFTTIDFPGKLAAVIFLKGCNLRCAYCHNPELVDCDSTTKDIPWETVMNFLRTRDGFLEGVVLSGGEPTIYPRLAEALKELRTLKLEIALHTNGCFPDVLSDVLSQNLVDFVAMDIKAPFKSYWRVSKTGDGMSARESAKTLISSGIPYEFRSTVHPDLLDKSQLFLMADEMKSLGAKSFVLQEFKPGNTLEPSLSTSALPWMNYETFHEFKSYFASLSIRGQI
ncbi:MAG: anaerobic ribonucleoside-triphosphate reductase activating protein [Candidatus Riflebacteria bacterium]|nr:anaerobic ribonucleoside-triphosphate reductase activating protein [Candidatus Riflebacteria bacterium]